MAVTKSSRRGFVERALQSTAQKMNTEQKMKAHRFYRHEKENAATHTRNNYFPANSISSSQPSFPKKGLSFNKHTYTYTYTTNPRKRKETSSLEARAATQPATKIVPAALSLSGQGFDVTTIINLHCIRTAGDEEQRRGQQRSQVLLRNEMERKRNVVAAQSRDMYESSFQGRAPMR